MGKVANTPITLGEKTRTTYVDCAGDCQNLGGLALVALANGLPFSYCHRHIGCPVASVGELLPH